MNWRQVAVAAARLSSATYFGLHGMRDPAGIVVTMLDRVPIAGTNVRGDRYYLYRENGAFLLYYEGQESRGNTSGVSESLRDESRSDGNDVYLFDVTMPPVYEEVILRNDEKNRNYEAWYLLDGLWYEIETRIDVSPIGTPFNMNDDFMPIETWGNRGRIHIGDRIIRSVQ